jgi:hypothetical protein
MSISGVTSNITKSSNSVDLYQGETKDLDLLIVKEVKDVNDVTVEEPVDLTGATIYFSVRRKASAPELLIGKDSTNILSIEIVAPPTSGQVIIHMLADDTKHMAAGEYVFDIWVVLSSGKRAPVVEISEFIVKEAVTKLP